MDFLKYTHMVSAVFKYHEDDPSRNHKRRGDRSALGTVPVFGVVAQQRSQDHHLVLTGSDFCYGEDLMLGLRVADVHHCAGPGQVLPQAAGSAIAQLHGVVGCHLPFDVFCGDLGEGKEQVITTGELPRLL